MRRCVNVLGQLTDEQHRVEHQAELLTAIDPEEDPARFLRRLQGSWNRKRSAQISTPPSAAASGSTTTCWQAA